SLSVEEGGAYGSLPVSDIFFGTVNPGQTLTDTINFTVNQSWLTATTAVITIRAAIIGGAFDTATSTNPGDCIELLVTITTDDSCGPEIPFVVTVTNNGQVAAENVVVNLTVTEGAVYAGTGLSSDILNFGTVAGGGGTDTQTVYFGTDQTTWPYATTAAITVHAVVNGGAEDFATSNNPGDCIDLAVSIATEDSCGPEIPFTVTVTNNGQLPMTNVVVDLTVLAGASYGTLSTNILDFGTVAPYTSPSQTVIFTTGIDWLYATGGMITVKAAIAEGSWAEATANNPGNCAPVITIEGEEIPSCADEGEEVCMTFTVTIVNLPEGLSVQMWVNGAPFGVPFTADGIYPVLVCGVWPGINVGSLYVETVFEAGLELTGQLSGGGTTFIQVLPEFVAQATGKVYYDPETMFDICFETFDLVLDAGCYEPTPNEWLMRWTIQNPNPFNVDIIWMINSGAPAAGVAVPGETVLIDLGLSQWYTVEAFWSPAGSASLKSFIYSQDCEGAPPPPPPPPPGPPLVIPVTGAPQPEVEGVVLIPVTGANLGSGLMGVGFFQKLMTYLGLAFLGMAFVLHGMKKRFRD
ncbi:MAG: hypothetical protein MUO76_11190, partial [Anaerolineaceae bacterium]|nr:hypothetical protein [Anaerolineaceae bacterium]